MAERVLMTMKDLEAEMKHAWRNPEHLAKEVIDAWIGFAYQCGRLDQVEEDLAHFQGVGKPFPGAFKEEMLDD